MESHYEVPNMVDVLPEKKEKYMRIFCFLKIWDGHNESLVHFFSSFFSVSFCLMFPSSPAPPPPSPSPSPPPPPPPPPPGIVKEEEEQRIKGVNRM